MKMNRFFFICFDRIQQLQLLSRELKGEQHEKLWKQLESEIHLHRHKTVVRACRSNSVQISSVRIMFVHLLHLILKFKSVSH